MEQSPEKSREGAARSPNRRTTVVALAGTSFVLELATVAVLLLDNCSLAKILAILAALFGGATVYMVTSASGDKPDPWGYDPPPKR